jgi:hypothetical protein
MGELEIKNILFGKSLLDGKKFWLKKEEETEIVLMKFATFYF